MIETSSFTFFPVPRLDESSPSTNKSTIKEGKDVVYEKDYQLPRSTIIYVNLTFKTNGKEYNLTMTAINQHTKQDVSILTWIITCGTPINPPDWNLEFIQNVRPGTPVSLMLKTKPNVPLPTKPILQITKVDGIGITNHPLELNPNASTIPFYLTFSAKDAVINCIEEVYNCTDIFTFVEMGIDPNVESGDDGTISPTYKDVLIATIAMDESDSLGGSYGFAVNFFNKLSNVSHDFETGDVVETEPDLLDAAPEGSGLWNATKMPKWQFNWINSFAKFEGTIQVEFQYTSHGNPSQYDMDLSDGTWYLPGSSVPAFSMYFLKGTARRVQYTLNNTDPNGYQPPPCIVDWPEPIITVAKTLKYTIKHCNGPVSSY